MSAISKKTGGIENSMLSLLFLAGILGVFYFLRQPGELPRSNRTAWVSDTPRTVGALQDRELGRSEFLEISGPMEQDVPVHFRISTFNEQVRYVLDLGNGARREFAGEDLRYTYRESGAFRVRLIAQYNGGEKLLVAKTVHISGSQELALEF